MSIFASLGSILAPHRTALFATSVVVGLAMAGGTAQADIIFTAGNNPGPDEENILFGAQFTGQTSIIGLTNQTHVPIIFNLIPGAPLGETSIGTNADGQADIVCTGACGTASAGGANGHQLTDLEIKLGAGFGATDFIGNLDFGEGTAKITVLDQLGATFDFVLGNGQNFFTLNAINGEVITDIQITELALDSNGFFGWNDFKQPRVSGLCALQGTTCNLLQIEVPEPSSLALFGAGLVAAWWFATRRKASSLT